MSFKNEEETRDGSVGGGEVSISRRRPGRPSSITQEQFKQVPAHVVNQYPTPSRARYTEAEIFVMASSTHATRGLSRQVERRD